MVIYVDNRPQESHIGPCNFPLSSEVASIIPGSENVQVRRLYIVLRRRVTLYSNGNEDFDIASVFHRSYDPLSYAILLPNLKDGWYPQFKFTLQCLRRKNKVTPTMFYSWQRFQQKSEFSTILNTARIFQQYLLDQYLEAESKSLSRCHNQQKPRASD